MSGGKIPTNPSYYDIVELQEEIFFPTKRNDDGEKIEGKKIPDWFFKLSARYYDMLQDIDYHLSGDITVDEYYFDRKIVELNSLIPNGIYERALLSYVDDII